VSLEVVGCENEGQHTTLQPPTAPNDHEVLELVRWQKQQSAFCAETCDQS